MAADDINMNQCPCAPAPSVFPEKNDSIAKLLPVAIEALVVVGVVMLFVLHVLGSLRRRSSNKALHGVVMGAYSLSYALVSYTLGLMQISKYYVHDFAIWAVCLLLLVGSADCLTACSLSDIENWKSHTLKHLTHGMSVVGIVLYFGSGSEFQWPLWAILCIIVLKSYARIASMKMAGKSYMLCKNMKRISDYMREDVLRASDSDQRPDPVTMQGYRYVVSGERRQKFLVKRPEYVLTHDKQCVKITTVEQIWSSTGSLLSSDGGGSGRGLLLKDICLSMALSKMLNRRFAGFELVEAELEKTHDFVFRGLLVGDKQWERVFRVVQEELAFVHDLYYTRYPYLYHKGRYLAFYLPFAMIGLCSWVIYLLFKRFKHDKFPMFTTTMILMVVVAILEVFQLYLYAASGWCKVALIRSYATMPVLQRNGLCQWAIGFFLRLKALRPWEDKLGQYCFIHAFDRRRRASKCLHYMTLCLVDKPKKGRERAKPVKVSRQLKQAVVDSLTESKGCLTNGVRSLRNHGVEHLLESVCGASSRTTTHTILVWHIATTLCKHKLDEQAKGRHRQLPEKDGSTIGTDSTVASSLSRYCAYLAAFEPDLLPDHSSVSALIFRESIKEARLLLKGAKTMKRKYEKLMDMSASSDGAGDVSLVVEGARLATRLNEDIPDQARRWRILSEFWAEMMLYLAPCDNARAHLEALATGGEFITHLWALLTHAGVLEVERDRAGPQAAV